MLPKKKRVTKDTFQTIMEKGSIISGSFFLFRYIKQDLPQYSFVAPKKVAKNAVERNFLRRRGYNILRTYKLNINSGIFFFKKEGIKASIFELKQDIDFLLKKAKII